MKKLLTLTITAGSIATALAQQPVHRNYNDDLMSRWVIDVNLMGGLATKTFTTAPSALNYPGVLNANTGQLKYNNGYSFGGDAQLGFFFGQKRHFGIGAGVMYIEQHGDAILNNYHVEYQATDGAGNIFRQVADGNDVRENITTRSYNIPVVLKYKTRFSKHWGFAADAGALINLQTKNEYNTHASFDYEAIYKLVPGGEAGTTSVYDNSPVPSPGDWMITKAEFLKNNPHGNVQDYFNAKRALGYNVGQGITPAKKTGSTSYTQGSVGLLLQPSVNYYLSDHVALNLGVYYVLQPLQNKAENNYRLTDGSGAYSSVLKNVTASTNQDYGINFGARFFFCRKQHNPLTISSMDQKSPTQCGLCDGSIALHGLPANEPVTVAYAFNNAPATYAATSSSDGKVVIPALCTGKYTGIVASVKRKHAEGKPITISDPVMRISTQNTVNQSAPGICDGSLRLGGLYAGQLVSINYKLNGTTAPTFSGIVDTTGAVTINGLCEGSYTGIVAGINNCTANGRDFTLAAPTPPPPPMPAPTPVTTAEGTDMNTPILFDFNKTTIHRSSYPLLNETSDELKKEKGLHIRVDAYTDAIGTDKYNQKLSVARANSVKKYLKNKGANPARIKVYGHGKSNPAGDNNTPEGRSKNRRAIMEAVPAK